MTTPILSFSDVLKKFRREAFSERDKVLILTLKEEQIPTALQNVISDKSNEINTDDISKLIGCIYNYSYCCSIRCKARRSIR